jgi:uncharacterized repeat protein (TIGR03803 family)
MTKIACSAWAALALGTVLSAAGASAQAQTFATLHSFTASPDGREPAGGLTPLAGKLYGTTNVGGAVDSGTIYVVDPATGAEQVLYSFVGVFSGSIDGNAPEGELVAANGVLYGTTSFGGTFNAGTVFRFDPATGAETLLHSFGSGSDGAMPAAGLVLAGGVLYGTTAQGGDAGLGTAFALDLASGQETVLHSFAGGADGSEPFAPLTWHGGVLYGTTFFGGPSNDGTVFRLDPATGRERVLHAFAGPAFSGNPAAGVTFHAGLLYGTTSRGGLQACGGGCGTVFQVDARTGAEADVYQFTGPNDGQDPEGGLVYSAGTLFGTTLTGGRSHLGTVFAVNPQTGGKVTLHDFEGRATGINPGTLVGFDHALYGTTHGGGGAGQGTVFVLAP